MHSAAREQQKQVCCSVRLAPGGSECARLGVPVQQIWQAREEWGGCWNAKWMSEQQTPIIQQLHTAQFTGEGIPTSGQLWTVSESPSKGDHTKFNNWVIRNTSCKKKKKNTAVCELLNIVFLKSLEWQDNNKDAWSYSYAHHMLALCAAKRKKLHPG